jgi:very-short-patch-repair endonuclease
MLARAQQLRANSNAAERRAWSILRSRRFAGLKFRRQHLIGDYVADFVCLPARLVIEVDGDTHGSDEAEAKDARRTRAIERAGFQVIRFWNHHVKHDREGGVADMILEALMASALPENEKARLLAEGYIASRELLSTPHPDPLPGGERE